MSDMNALDKVKAKVFVDGFEIVPDLEKSQGATLIDKKDGRPILDLGYSQFGSLALGYNHPAMRESDYLKKLAAASDIRWALSDVYPDYYGDFVEALGTVIPPEYTHFFFVDGGGPAVENGLKVAFDWRTRKNLHREAIPGDKVIHFKSAFHGRLGYALSMTNTADPNKFKYFPKFDWPRVHNPVGTFKRDGSVAYDREELARRQIESACDKFENRIAALIIEPIQGEGGDGYFSPDFFRFLRKTADENGFLLMFDEIQTGWSTGKWWAFEHITGGTRPDIFSFGKKTQQCGIACTGRMDDVESVFKVSGRINSTWGGTLADMVRSTRYIEVIRKEHLLENTAKRGEQVRKALLETDDRHVLNIRGCGGWQAFTLPSTKVRDSIWKECYREGCLVLKAGERTIRLRLNLALSEQEAETGLKILQSAIKEGAKKTGD
jgi:L-lysine 6-transaminase